MTQLLGYNMYMTKAVKNTLLTAQLSNPGGSSPSTAVQESYAWDIMHCGCAAVSLLLLAPLFLIIGLTIKLSSRGPIIERGLRVGKDGRIFTLYTFATRCPDAEASTTVRLLPDRDARCTRIGTLLKQTKLDQLPQLVNVLKGDMNFVGPRPIQPIFLEKRGRATSRYSAYLAVKPGLTDLAPEGDGYFSEAREIPRYQRLGPAMQPARHAACGADAGVWVGQ
jgi:lipopolysaccharide/colanic/teichoic acid biosynthesis glycosyltransferase